jgi:hypothetical protein
MEATSPPAPLCAARVWSLYGYSRMMMIEVYIYMVKLM